MRRSRSGSPLTRWCVQDLESEKDEVLVSLAQSGDGKATEILLRRYLNTVRARARRFFLIGGETDDLVQEGMIGLYAAIGDYRPDMGKSFKNFAYLCVTRHILDAVKSSCRRKNSPLNQSMSLFDPVLSEFPEEETPEDFLLEGEQRTEFRMKLLKELSDLEFRVLAMYLEGMSYARICEATGKDMKSVDNALVRAKKKLQKIYL